MSRISSSIKRRNSNHPVPVSGSGLPSLYLSRDIAKQVGYHSKAVQNKSSNDKMATLVRSSSLVKRSCIDAQVQTDDPCKSKNRMSDWSLRKIRPSITLPEMNMEPMHQIKHRVVKSVHEIQASVEKISIPRLPTRENVSAVQEDRMKWTYNRMRVNDTSKPKQQIPKANYRRTSILDQVESKRANSVKREMVNQLQRSFSRHNELKKEEDQFWKDTISPPPVPNRRCSYQVGQDVGERRNVKRQLRLQRSFSADLAPSTKNIPVRRSKRISLYSCAPEVFRSDRNKRKMSKMWGKQYTEMCNRANVLNHIIEVAGREEVSVKPINVVDDSSKKEEKKGKKKEKDRLLMGLSKRFYNVSEDVESEEESIDLNQTDDFEHQTMIFVNLAPTLVLNKRTKSVDVLFPLKDTEDCNPKPSVSKTHSTENMSEKSRPKFQDIAKRVRICNILARPKRNSLEPLKVDRSTQVNLDKSPSRFSRSESPESRPVERQIEARSGSEDGLGSMVRCINFATTFIASRK